MNKPLIEGTFHSEAMERQGHKALQQAAYEVAFDVAKQNIDSADTVAKEMAVVRGQLAALQADQKAVIETARDIASIRGSVEILKRKAPALILGL